MNGPRLLAAAVVLFAGGLFVSGASSSAVLAASFVPVGLYFCAHGIRDRAGGLFVLGAVLVVLGAATLAQGATFGRWLGDLSDPLEWTPTETGTGGHELGPDFLEVRHDTLTPEYDYLAVTRRVTSEDWSWCGLVAVKVDYDLALAEVVGGSSPIAAVAFAGFSENQSGLVGTKTGVFADTWAAPFDHEITLAVWINGGRGHARADLDSRCVDQNLHRMTPEVKERLLKLVKTLDLVGAATAASGLANIDPRVASAFAFIAANMAYGRLMIKQAVDEDPYDPAYGTLYPVTVGPVPEEFRDTVFWRLLTTLAREAALAEALYHTVNRVNSAAIDADHVAEDRQQGYLDELLHHLADRFRDDARQREARALKRRLRDVPDHPIADPVLIRQLRAAAAAIDQS